MLFRSLAQGVRFWIKSESTQSTVQHANAYIIKEKDETHIYKGLDIRENGSFKRANEFIIETSQGNYVYKNVTFNQTGAITKAKSFYGPNSSQIFINALFEGNELYPFYAEICRTLFPN